MIAEEQASWGAGEGAVLATKERTKTTEVLAFPASLGTGAGEGGRDSERSGSSNGSLFLEVRSSGLERQVTFREFCSLVKGRV